VAAYLGVEDEEEAQDAVTAAAARELADGDGA
jgi:hypothetical protein